METIEQIILRHGQRGMDLLAPALPGDFCCRAAKAVLALPRGTVLLTTGFYVAGFAETDGPSGTWAAALAFQALGFTPIIVTDEYSRGFYEPAGLQTEYLDIDAGEAECQALLDKYQPVLLFALERCGVNTVGDYQNMRGRSIRPYTAPCDLLFTLSAGRIPSIGIGDGGNEIGMGTLADVIRQKLPLIPCEVSVDYPMIATVSNWGGYGLCAWLQRLTGLPLLPTADAVIDFLRHVVAVGSVDGVSCLHEPTEDGYSEEITR